MCGAMIRDPAIYSEGLSSDGRIVIEAAAIAGDFIHLYGSCETSQSLYTSSQVVVHQQHFPWAAKQYFGTEAAKEFTSPFKGFFAAVESLFQKGTMLTCSMQRPRP